MKIDCFKVLTQNGGLQNIEIYATSPFQFYQAYPSTIGSPFSSISPRPNSLASLDLFDSLSR